MHESDGQLATRGFRESRRAGAGGLHGPMRRRRGGGIATAGVVLGRCWSGGDDVDAGLGGYARWQALGQTGGRRGSQGIASSHVSSTFTAPLTARTAQRRPAPHPAAPPKPPTGTPPHAAALPLPDSLCCAVRIRLGRDTRASVWLLGCSLALDAAFAMPGRPRAPCPALALLGPRGHGAAANASPQTTDPVHHAACRAILRSRCHTSRTPLLVHFSP